MGITRTYELGGEKAGVFEVSLEVPAGPSGSGRTALLQVAGLLDVPDEGEVRLKGRAMSGLPETIGSSTAAYEAAFKAQT